MPLLFKVQDGLAKWRELLDSDQFPGLVEDGSLGENLIEIIEFYRKILDARDEPFPENFILQDVLDLHEERFAEPDESTPAEEDEEEKEE